MSDKVDKPEDMVKGDWFGAQGGIDKDNVQLLYDVKSMKQYEEGGFKPIPEHAIKANHFEFNRNTINEILPPEMAYSFFNHYKMFEDMHRAEFSKPLNVLKRCAREIAHAAAYYMGRGSSAESLPKNIHSGPCIIVASGCSLDPVLPMLKDWKGGLVCSSSHAATLMYHGAPPTHVINFDMRTQDNEYDAKRWDYKKTTLITWPGMHPSVNGLWKGHKYFYRVFDPSVAFYAWALPAGYNWIETQMQPFAQSTAMQMAAANYMGYSPLILVGADFCMKPEATRFTSHWYRKPEGEKRKRWVESKPGTVDAIKESSLIITSAGGKLTLYTFLHYRRATIAELWSDGSNVFDCSDGTLNGLLPKADIEEVIATQGTNLRGRMRISKQIRDSLEPWLATEESYFIPMLGGHKLILAPDPVILRASLHQLHQYDDNLDAEKEFKRLDGLRVKGEAMRKSGQYGEAGLRE
jgi:hypothetical protein